MEAPPLSSYAIVVLDGQVALASNSVLNWPENDHKFSSLFDDLPSYCADVKRWQISKGYYPDETGVTTALKEIEMITLPKKSWNVSENQRFGRFLGSQAMMLRSLLKTVYVNLTGVQYGDPEIQ